MYDLNPDNKSFVSGAGENFRYPARIDWLDRSECSQESGNYQ
jgi:hypothetical protein